MADDLGIGAVLDAALAPLVAEREARRAERDALEEALRAAKRQAAPFRRRKGRPGRPGCRPGPAPANRPVPDHVDAERFGPLVGCPCRGGDVEDVADLPPEIWLWVRRFRTQSGCCRRCRRPVCSRHPEQHSTATGASPSTCATTGMSS